MKSKEFQICYVYNVYSGCERLAGVITYNCGLLGTRVKVLVNPNKLRRVIKVSIIQMILKFKYLNPRVSIQCILLITKIS